MSYHQGIPFWANTTAVSSRSSGRRPVTRLLSPVAFSVLMNEILRTERGRIVRRLHLRQKLGVPDTQPQAFGPHRFEMRPAHHAGYVVPGQRQPHRKMAADGAGTEECIFAWGRVLFICSLMVRRRSCAVSNHQGSVKIPILRDAAKTPLLRMRKR